ncbi:MAG: hypothetical protein RI996_35 [Candidatus Parcubacteria bacterium]|jgi:hypothetical protein
MKTQYETLYNQLVNSCDQMLSILNKANDAIESGIVNEEELMTAELVPGMYNFTKQVQIFSDMVQGSVCRLSGIEKPSIKDDEKNISDLIARVEMTKLYVKNTDITTLNGEDKKIHLGWMPEKGYFEGSEYAEKYVLQNTFFHLVTAYNILRTSGGDIGKADFIVGLTLKQSE